jgi:hypothetical protein
MFIYPTIFFKQSIIEKLVKTETFLLQEITPGNLLILLPHAMGVSPSELISPLLPSSKKH